MAGFPKREEYGIESKTIDRSGSRQSDNEVEGPDRLLHTGLEQEIRRRVYKIYLEGAYNLVMNWRIGFRRNVSSRRIGPTYRVSNVSHLASCSPAVWE
jgi:hypothetical protein